jgi:hypothetical protein
VCEGVGEGGLFLGGLRWRGMLDSLARSLTQSSDVAVISYYLHVFTHSLPQSLTQSLNHSLTVLCDE